VSNEQHTPRRRTQPAPCVLVTVPSLLFLWVTDQALLGGLVREGKGAAAALLVAPRRPRATVARRSSTPSRPRPSVPTQIESPDQRRGRGDGDMVPAVGDRDAYESPHALRRLPRSPFGVLAAATGSNSFEFALTIGSDADRTSPPVTILLMPSVIATSEPLATTLRALAISRRGIEPRPICVVPPKPPGLPPKRSSCPAAPPRPSASRPWKMATS
jgi:hypothetical protein